MFRQTNYKLIQVYEKLRLSATTGSVCQSVNAKFILIIIICSLSEAKAQNIGINGTGANAHPSALLDIDAIATPSLGLLIPRIALQAINVAAPVISPATSLLVYNTASASTGTNAVSAGYYYWDGIKWVRFAYNASGSSSTAWDLLGNAGTTAGTHFLGTTDPQDLVFKTNGLEAVRVTTAGNVGIGTTIPFEKIDVLQGSILARSSTSLTTAYLHGDGGIDLYRDNTAPGGSTNGYLDFKNDPTDDYKVRLAYNRTLGSKGSFVLVTDSTGSYSTIVDRERLVVNISTGNVGVGITIPKSLLDVRNGGIGASNITFNVQREFAGETNTTAAFIGGTDGFYGRSGIYVMQKDNSAITSSNSYLLNVVTNEVSQMVVNGAGRVGIGTKTPLALLHIEKGNIIEQNENTFGIISSTAYSSLSSVHSGRFIGYRGRGTIGSSLPAITDDLLSGFEGRSPFGGVGGGMFVFAAENQSATNAGTYLTFNNTQIGGTSLLENMRILSNGNVGIGTTSPTLKLHLHDATQNFHALRFTAGVSQANYWDIAKRGDAYSTGENHNLVFAYNSTSKLTITPTGNVGIGPSASAPTFKLEVAGTTACTGNVWTSDRRKKQNIQPLTIDGLDIINKLKPVIYEWKQVLDDGMKGIQMGFIAQELEQILPSMVVTTGDTDQSKSVKYIELLPIYAKAIQEQQKQISELLNRIEVLEKK